MYNRMPRFSNYPTVLMDHGMIQVMVSFLLDHDCKNADQALEAMAKFPLFKVYEGWIARSSFTMTNQLKAFLFLVICQSSGNRPFGFDVYFLNMQQYSQENGIKEWTIETFAEMLPDGFPNQETLELMWDAWEAS